VLSLLRDAVDQFNQTVVMVTHDADAASVGDRIVVLRDGKVVRDAPAAQIEDVHELMKTA
jgi:putative ABC transport system ATP-binding protein